MELKPTHSNYYIMNQSRITDVCAFRSVSGTSIKIKGWEDFDFFVHRNVDNENFWVVSEGMTGLSIVGIAYSGNISTRKESIEKAYNKLQKITKKYFREMIDCAINDTGLSPRYK